MRGAFRCLKLLETRVYGTIEGITTFRIGRKPIEMTLEVLGCGLNNPCLAADASTMYYCLH
jgi:hypothetical protein